GLTGGLIVVNQERQRAVAAEKKTRKALDQADVAMRTLTQSLPNLDEEQREVLANVLRDLQSLAGELEQGQGRSRDWQLTTTVVETWFRIGSFATLLGQEQDALSAFGRAIELYTLLAEHLPDDPVYQDELAKAHFDLAFLLTKLGKPGEAAV